MESESSYTIPARDWFNRPVLEVAAGLINARLTHHTDDGNVTIRIVEVEAYHGAQDPGSHAYRGQTQRNKTMFGSGGHLYVYRHLGLHVCANIVAGPEGQASGILLRAGEVVDGVPMARLRRRAKGVNRTDLDLAKGPARLTVSLGITADDDGADLLELTSPFMLEIQSRAVSLKQISCGPRVGVSGEGGRADKYPWRLWLTGDPCVSAYRPAAQRATNKLSETRNRQSTPSEVDPKPVRVSLDLHLHRMYVRHYSLRRRNLGKGGEGFE